MSRSYTGAGERYITLSVTEASPPERRRKGLSPEATRQRVLLRSPEHTRSGLEGSLHVEEVTPMELRRTIVKSMIGVVAICVFLLLTAGLARATYTPQQRPWPSPATATITAQTTPPPDATATALAQQKLAAEV